MAHNAPFATSYNAPASGASRAPVQRIASVQPSPHLAGGSAPGERPHTGFSLLAYLQVPAPRAVASPQRGAALRQSDGERGVRVVAPAQRPPRPGEAPVSAAWVDPPAAGRPSRRSPRHLDPTLQQPDAAFWAQAARPVASPRGVTPTRPARRRIPLPPRVAGPPGGADGGVPDPQQRGDTASEVAAAGTSSTARGAQPPPPPAKDHLAHARASGNQAAKYTEGLLIVNPEFTHKARRAPAPPWSDRERHDYLMKQNQAVDEQARRKAIRGYTGMVPLEADNSGLGEATSDAQPPPLPPPLGSHASRTNATILRGSDADRRSADGGDARRTDADARAVPQDSVGEPDRRPSHSDLSAPLASSLDIGTSSPPRGRFTDREFEVMRTVRAYHDRRDPRDDTRPPGQGAAPYATGYRPQQRPSARQPGPGPGPDRRVDEQWASEASEGAIPSAPSSPVNRKLVFGSGAQQPATAWPTSPRRTARQREHDATAVPGAAPTKQGSPSSILDLQAQATSRQLVHLRQRQGEARAQADRVSDQHRAESAQSAVAVQRQQRLAAKLAAQGDLPEASHVRKLAEQQRRASRRREAQQRAELDKRRREELAYAEEARRARDRLYRLREAQAQVQASATRKRVDASRNRAEAAALVTSNPFVQPVNGRERGDVDLQAAGLVPGMRARRKAPVRQPVAPGSHVSVRAAAPSPSSTVLDTDEYLRRLDEAVKQEAQLLTHEMQEGQRARAREAVRQRATAEAALRAKQQKLSSTTDAVAEWDRAVAQQRARRADFERLKAYERAKQEQLTREWNLEAEARERASQARSRDVQHVLERQRYLAGLQRMSREAAAIQTPASALSFI